MSVQKDSHLNQLLPKSDRSRFKRRLGYPKGIKSDWQGSGSMVYSTNTYIHDLLSSAELQDQPS